MILDNLLTFTGTSNGATGGITSGAQTDLPTTGTQVASNIIDLGLAGLPTSANGGGARDIGTGDDPMLKLSVMNTAAWTATATLQLILQGDVDGGSGTPSGAWVTMWTSPVFATATLQIIGQLCNIDVPRPVPTQPLPRFLRLEFVTAVTTNSTGTIEAQIVIDRDDQVVGITGLYSGYRAGITVAN